VQDAASLIGCLAENDCEGNFQIFNGGSGQRQTVLDILLALVDELQVKTKVEMCGRVKEGDPRHYWADTSKVEEIGWKARYSFSDGLKEYIEWFSKRKLLELRL
jgi:dTDP-L-rhamnose 4-epimerase